MLTVTVPYCFIFMRSRLNFNFVLVTARRSLDESFSTLNKNSSLNRTEGRWWSETEEIGEILV